MLCADPTDKLLVRDVKQAKELGWYAYNPQLPWLCFDTLKLARAVNPPPPKKSGAKSKAKSKSDTTSSNSQQTLRRRFGIRPGAVAHRSVMHRGQHWGALCSKGSHWVRRSAEECVAAGHSVLSVPVLMWRSSNTECSAVPTMYV